VEDPASTPALDYTWSASTTYSVLLTILNIDTRIVVREHTSDRNNYRYIVNLISDIWIILSAIQFLQ
jgi:hypothetical protein